MGSSKLKTESRNKLYFNKFQYKATCRILGAGYTYFTPNIETFIERMKRFRDANSQSKYGVLTMDDSWKVYWDEINIDQITQFLTWRDQVSKDKCMIRIQSDSVSFFSDDLSLLQTLTSIDPKVKFTTVKQLDSKTMYFKKEPKFKFRTYFKSRRMPPDFSDNVRNLRDIYTDTLHFSESLCKTLFDKGVYNRFRYMHGSYYVEYNDDQMLTILSMWFPTMLAKTYTCVKQP